MSGEEVAREDEPKAGKPQRRELTSPPPPLSKHLPPPETPDGSVPSPPSPPVPPPPILVTSVPPSCVMSTPTMGKVVSLGAGAIVRGGGGGRCRHVEGGQAVTTEERAGEHVVTRQEPIGGETVGGEAVCTAVWINGGGLRDRAGEAAHHGGALHRVCLKGGGGGT